jgi:hypothetical protein
MAAALLRLELACQLLVLAAAVESKPADRLRVVVAGSKKSPSGQY